MNDAITLVDPSTNQSYTLIKAHIVGFAPCFFHMGKDPRVSSIDIFTTSNRSIQLRAMYYLDAYKAEDIEREQVGMQTALKLLREAFPDQTTDRINPRT